MKPTNAAIEFPADMTAKVPKRILKLLPSQDSAVKVRDALRKSFAPEQVSRDTDQRWAWEQVAYVYSQWGRASESIIILDALYEHMLCHQDHVKRRVHKGVPLFWLSDCHRKLGNPVLSKRYLMLAVVEDSISDRGTINAQTTGTYHQCVWRGMAEEKYREYARRFWSLSKTHRRESRYPEWLLQEVDQEWMTEQPSAQETRLCPVNGHFVQCLLQQLGRAGGKPLERLANYLLSCIPGCRSRMRLRSKSTDYDVLGILEGAFADFRSELGRYFLCECKDWSTPADFSALAKFSRVLDSSKTKFGILFSRNGITGSARTSDAERELLKIFQDRGVAIIVVTREDLEQIAQGENFVTMLRQKYEQVRFDLSLGSAKRNR